MNAIPNIVVIPLKGDLDVTTVASASALIDSFLYREYPRMISVSYTHLTLPTTPYV